MAQQYPKRSGTSGIRGQLYETKLISLIYFRAIYDYRIEEFHLATNVDKLGSFDDICFKAKLRGIDKPLTVFIQAKHRENSNSVLTFNKSDLSEYFNSYLEIRRKFNPNNKDVLFNGQLSETDCIFVVYTTAKGDKKIRTYEGSLAEQLNALLRTGGPGSQPSHESEDVELLCEIVLEKQMTVLARQMAKCIFGDFNDIQTLMQDELVLRYHVILGQKVFNISEIQQEGHRNASFRNDFFDINEEFLRLFKDELCTEILKRRSRGNTSQFEVLLNSLTLLREITDTETLYKEVGSRFIYKNGKFVFLDKNTPDCYMPFLDKINESQENIRKTVEMAVKECLPTQTFKVPASFGNKDLTIRGGPIKIERKLNDLTFKIVKFIDKSKPSKVVIIDDSFGAGFLQLSGGIASAVGNLLIFDESSKLIKFNDNCESLGNLAKHLYCKLKEKNDNLNEYKFDVKAKIFPKFTVATDDYNKNVVSDFLSTLLFYTSQHNEKDVEEKLIYEINNSQGDDVQHVEVTSDAIFLKYHDEIQKWSMTSEMGTYLKKEGSLYKNSVKHMARQPLISVINMMQRIKNKNYTFRKDVVNSIMFDDLSSGTIIITENSALTVAKLIKHLNNKDAAVLDFEYITNLSLRDEKALRTELMSTKEVKTLIVVFNNTLIATSPNGKIENIANSMKHHTVIIITDQNSVANVKKYFSRTGKVVKDVVKLIDMSDESQKLILENTNVIFQGKEVRLGQILINDTIEYVEGSVLNKMMHINKGIIGKPVSNSNYKPQLYIHRRVRPFFRDTVKLTKIQPARLQENFDRKQIQTLDALEDDVIIVFGDPGMGKSTLLTHLSLKTIENWTDMGWIVRVNLLEHTSHFCAWKDKKTDVNTMESLKFLCQAALSEESVKTNDLNITFLQHVDGTVRLESYKGDEWTLFELKMFLNFYNSNRIIIVLDGFDEICPIYANEVLALIKAVKKFPRTRKMWITSRSCDKMHTLFVNLKFGTLFQIEPLDVDEQDFYLTTFWDEKKILKDLYYDHFKNICDCIRYLATSRHVTYMLSTKTNMPIELKKDMPFFLIGLSLIKYLKMKISAAPPSVMTVLNELFHACYMRPNQIFENVFVVTPLHLNIMADYFYHKIKEINIKQKSQRDWDYNIFNIYEYYLETNLKIRFQEKAQNDMSKPDNISVYEREYADSIVMHKKLAAYGLYYRSRSKLFDDCELKQIVEMIIKLKEGEERTGIICNVVDDIPIFVHSTFEEYLAVEYICDLIKTRENQKHLWDFILNVMFFGNMNVLATLDSKIKIDHKLLALFEEHKIIIFELLLKQVKNIKQGKIKSCISESIRYNLRNLARFFIFPTLNGNLNQSNLMDFIEIIKKTNILLLAVKMENESIVVSIVDHVKRIDISKLSVLFENIELNENVAELSIDDLLQKLHSYVWTRMDQCPYG